MDDDRLDQDMDESEGDEQFDFPPPERKITTQPYDLSISTLVEQWRTKMLLIPDIQREYVWDNGRASRLIESLILGVPVPPLYFAETKDARFEVIDGHQRVRSIARFLTNEFRLSGLRVLPEYKGMPFHKLPGREQRFLSSRTLRVVVITYDSHPSMKFEVFERLNTGGISLNAQELRNSIYRGPFNEMLKEAVKAPAFRDCMGSARPRRRMVDEELVLRFLALRDRLRTYRPPLKRVLNDFMGANREADAPWLQEQYDGFNSTMESIAATLGPQAFRLIDAAGQPLKDRYGRTLPRGVNRALFDAQALAFSWAISPVSSSSRGAVVTEVARALTNPDTQDATRRATGDRRRLLERTQAMVGALEAAGVQVSVPFDLSAEGA